MSLVTTLNLHFTVPSVSGSDPWKIHYWGAGLTATTWAGDALSTSILTGYYSKAFDVSKLNDKFYFVVNKGGDAWKTGNQTTEAAYLLVDRFFTVNSDQTVTRVVDPR